MGHGRAATHPALRPANRWISLFVMTRILGAAGALTLLTLHRVTDNDPQLFVITLAWAAFTVIAVPRVEALPGSPAFWLLDVAVALGLVYVSGDWRSPFYVMFLTTLVLPCTQLRFRHAVAWGAVFAVSYGVTAVLTGRLQTLDLETSVRLETAATHLMVPVVVALALAYASDLLDRLREEQARAEQMALQAERERIAWELHDSAKQRVHAAHLLLTAVGPRDGSEPVLEQALDELRAATADMETSVAELQSPLDGRPLHEAVGERAAELAPATQARIDVRGSAPALPPLVAAHAQRIVAEALTNAVRHAGATAIEVHFEQEDGHLRIAIVDDGVGMPEVVRPGASGLRSMTNRATTIGAHLDVGAGPGGRGTAVRLQIPTTTREKRP